MTKYPLGTSVPAVSASARTNTHLYVEEITIHDAVLNVMLLEVMEETLLIALEIFAEVHLFVRLSDGDREPREDPSDEPNGDKSDLKKRPDYNFIR